jgi:hypothetical protein
MEHPTDGGKVTLTETQASGGTKEHVVRYVLVGSLALVVVAFIVAYLVS